MQECSPLLLPQCSEAMSSGSAPSNGPQILVEPSALPLLSANPQLALNTSNCETGDIYELSVNSRLSASTSNPLAASRAIEVSDDECSSRRVSKFTGTFRYVFHTRHRLSGSSVPFQSKIYNFLERPTGWKCFIYHFTV